MNNMSISEMKREIVHNIKSIDIAVAGFRRRFERTLPEFKYEEELHEEIMDYVYEHIHELSSYLSHYPELKDINNNNIKVECWFMNKEDNTTATVDLDDYYSQTEPCQYTLVIGGKRHGYLIVNGDHPHNANYGNGDIVYNLTNYLCGKYNLHIHTLRDMVQDYFDHWLPIKKEIKLKRENFKNYIEKFRIDSALDIYERLDQYHPFIIGYSDKGRQLYYAVYNHSTRILYDISTKLQNSKLHTDEYLARLHKLRETIESVQRKMKDWFENGQKCVYYLCKQHNIPSEINKQIMCFV